jgi:hypothetical protein
LYNEAVVLGIRDFEEEDDNGLSMLLELTSRGGLLTC